MDERERETALEEGGKWVRLERERERGKREIEGMRGRKRGLRKKRRNGETKRHD